MHVLFGAAFLMLVSGATPAPQVPVVLQQAPAWAGCRNTAECNNAILALHDVAALQTQAILDLNLKLVNLENRIGTLENGEHDGE